MDGMDAADNQCWYREWDEQICLNGNLCTHPACPEHEVRDFWDRTDWPTLMTDSEHMMILVSTSEEPRSGDIGSATQS